MTTLVTIVNVWLGLFNAWMLVRSRRVTLKVVPHVPPGPAIGGDQDTYETRITVTNLGQFSIYVSEVGFTYRGQEHEDSKLPDAGRQFPRLVEPRQTIRISADARYLLGDFKQYPIKCAYAKTSCGRRRTGTSPSLLDYELMKASTNPGALWWIHAERVRVRALAWIDRNLF